MFRQPLPSFNLKGNENVNTVLGALGTLMFGLIIMLYASVKFWHVATVKGATITVYDEPYKTNEKTIINLNDFNFRVAFGFYGYYDRELKIDPNYVRWIFRLSGKRQNKYVERILPYHICTAEDYAEFYPIENKKEV